jgi:hypothetical protein
LDLGELIQIYPINDGSYNISPKKDDRHSLEKYKGDIDKYFVLLSVYYYDINSRRMKLLQEQHFSYEILREEGM